MKITKIQIIGNLVGLIPGIYLLYRVLSVNLSANPIQTATVFTGKTAIYALLVSLFASPLSRLLKLRVFHQIRKTAGIYGFYYALVHFLIFVWADYEFNLSWIIPELKQKTYLQLGLIGLFFLIPLAITSIERIKKELGRTWKKVHSSIYIIVMIILLHVALASKGDLINPAILIALYLLAMIMRLPFLKSVHINNPPPWFKKIDAFLTC